MQTKVLYDGKRRGYNNFKKDFSRGGMQNIFFVLLASKKIYTCFHSSCIKPNQVYTHTPRKIVDMVCCELFFLNIYEVVTWVVLRYIFFRQITTFIKVLVTFAFGLKTLSMVDFTWIYQLKSLKPKNKGDTNFYECCDLTKKVYLVILHGLGGEGSDFSKDL